MSLINKMLQDLDARGGAGTRAPSGDVRPVAGHTPRTSRAAIATGAGVGVLIVAIAGGVWYWMHRAPPPVPAAAVLVPPVPAPPAVAPVLPAEPARVEPAAQVPAATPAPVAGLSAPSAPAPAAAPPSAAPALTTSGAPRARRASRDVATPAPAADRVVAPGVTMTPQQQGENAYRRALAAVQDGRVQDGIAALEQAVYVYPRHEAARQTLVGLLLESGRADEALRHAQLGLGLNANQPELAMLLARLQVERGGDAVETLRRTLPHAAQDAGYLAFLAGVLQKAGRHGEAAEQYEAALRLQPENGVWWMGLGMSLQAQKLVPQARDAYLKAKAAGLSPELREFLERKLAQLN